MYLLATLDLNQNVSELAKKPCAEVFGRDDFGSAPSNVSPWMRTPSTVGMTR
jgi:hypothetical protein